MANATPQSEASTHKPRRSLAGQIAITERWHGPDDPRVGDLRRDLRAQQLEEHIRRVVDEMPPLTPEQLSKLSALLAPGIAAARAAKDGGGADAA